MMTYELWETQSGNVMASFQNEGQALAAVVDRARRHGPESVESIALVRIGEIVKDPDGEEDADMEMLGSGVDLLVRAETPAPDGAPPIVIGCPTGGATLCPRGHASTNQVDTRSPGGRRRYGPAAWDAGGSVEDPHTANG
jgi:hypothetical protein